MADDPGCRARMHQIARRHAYAILETVQELARPGRHGLSGGIALVVARTSHDSALLKPSPHLIEKAVRGLGADPASALAGGFLTDIEAAHHADIASVGCASKPGERERMTELRAGAVMTSRADLALSLRAHRANGELRQLPLQGASPANSPAS